MKRKFTDNLDELKKEVNNAWGNSDFGYRSKLHVVRFALLKRASGYSNGHTADCILKELNMITEKLTLTKKGKYWLWEFFEKGYK